MFTGIVEEVGEVIGTKVMNTNIQISISCSFIKDIGIDQSIAHDGVCLTVTDVDKEFYKVEAVDETLKKSNLRGIKVGQKINLERCLKVGSRLDGHIVLGHVDTSSICLDVLDKHGSWEFIFSLPKDFEDLVVPKGSICINGVSLTLMNLGKDQFSVAIIPYTYQHTNFKYLSKGDIVNLEFDILGKYLKRQLSVITK